MKKYVLACLLVVASVNANAITQQCPPSYAYRHLGSGAIWEVSNEYLNQGWYVSQTPAAQNYNSNSSQSNPLTVVISGANDAHTFYMTCKNELMTGLTVDAVLNVGQVDPSSNPNFTRIDGNTYVCNTTINHPEACTSNTTVVSRVVTDPTGGSIN